MVNKMFPSTVRLKSRQEGATLIAGLIFLLILSIVGMAAMDVTTVDVKVVANAKDRQLAFNAAESELFQAGKTVNDTTGPLTNAATGYKGTTYAGNSSWWADNQNWTAIDAAGKSDYAIEAPTVYQDVASNKVTNFTMDNVTIKPEYHEYPSVAKARGPGGAEVALASQFLKKIENNAL